MTDIEPIIRATGNLIVAIAFVYAGQSLLSVHRGIINKSVTWCFRFLAIHFANAGYIYLARETIGISNPYFFDIPIGRLYAIGDYVAWGPTLIMILIITGKARAVAERVIGAYDQESE